jgi:hypothetical protein
MTHYYGNLDDEVIIVIEEGHQSGVKVYEASKEAIINSAHMDDSGDYNYYIHDNIESLPYYDAENYDDGLDDNGIPIKAKEILARDGRVGELDNEFIPASEMPEEFDWAFDVAYHDSRSAHWFTSKKDAIKHCIDYKWDHLIPDIKKLIILD